jgi:uncharacterized protein
MLLDLNRFRGGSDHLDRTIPADGLPLTDDEFRVAAPIHLQVDVRKDQEKVRLVGRLRTTIGVDCSRCLEAYEIPVDAPIDVLFLPASENTGEHEREVQEEDLGVSYYRDDVIDLAEIIREQLYLALPMKPLCREDCQGLCPVCGVNRNRETCTCQAEWVDPRMEPLRRLKSP